MINEILLSGMLIASPLNEAAIAELSNTHPKIEAVSRAYFKNTSKLGNIAWKTLDEGLLFSQIPVIIDSDTVDIAAIVKVDPQQYDFKAFFDYNSKTIEKWQAQLEAKVVVNASYWEQDHTPTNHYVADGKLLVGQFPRLQRNIWGSKERYFRGAFVAGPKEQGKPPADIITIGELTKTMNPEEEKAYNNPNWNIMVESYPMLIYPDGSIKVKHNPQKTANRTVIATTTEGDILLIATEKGNLSLYETARFLKDSPLNIKAALNMDGGIATEMTINDGESIIDVDSTRYTIHGSTERDEYGIIKCSGMVGMPIPTVIGVYSK